MTSLSGHHAIVTGGNSGIGAAIALELAQAGAAITIVGRDREKLRSVGEQIDGACLAQADVTQPQDVEAAFAQARNAHGPATILINNAGAAMSAGIASITQQQWRDAMAVNLDAVFTCSQTALPDLLRADAGRIVTIASTAGHRGYRYTAPYVAAKHGAIGLTRALALELANTNVTVNAVCPGFTDTNIVADAVKNITAKTGRSEEEARKALASHNPQKRLIMPQEVASAVLWLCLPASQSVTGQSIMVAGGEIM